MTGRALGVSTSTSQSDAASLDYVATSVTQPIYIATYPVIVTWLGGRQRVNGGAGAQITFVKCASGVVAANGVALHTGIFDASTGGTADANQSLLLVTNLAQLTMAPGDCVMAVIAGTMTAAVGFIQVVVEPVS